MPRKKTDRKIGNTRHENIKEGLRLIRSGESIRKASKTVNVPFATLKRYYWKTKNCESLDELLPSQLEPNYSVNKIFTEEQETALLLYGLTGKDSRKVAYQCAKMNNLKMPASWEKKQMAGKDWLISFRQRHNISLNNSEPCSLARATAFKQSDVSKFYDNLENLISRSPSFADGTRIFNLDETSCNGSRLATKGRRIIGKETSGEKGTIVTTCCIVSSSGNFLPPVMIFPRENFKSHMIKNTPPGTLGLATASGCINSVIFPDVMKHFIKHTSASKENPCILIMDNQESHLGVEALDLAKNAGVHILTVHPRTSAKLQPLNVGIYGPFKIYYNAAIDSWLLRNPGKSVTIYDLGELIGTAFQKAMTPRNITNAFAKCGIYPFDRHLFTKEDFLPSSVTDRPCPEDQRGEDASTPDSISALDEHALAPAETLESHEQPGSVPDAAKQSQLDVENATFNRNTRPKSTKELSSKSPFELRNPIKDGPTKTNRKRRKYGCSMIATDTPEKTLINQEKNEIKGKAEAKKKKATHGVLLDSDVEIENYVEVQLAESDDGDDWIVIYNM